MTDVEQHILGGEKKKHFLSKPHLSPFENK